MIEWLSSALDAVLGFLASIVSLLQPGSWLVWAAELLASILPGPVDMSSVLGSWNTFLDYVAPWFLAADYFVNMPFLAGAIGLMLTIEFGLNTFRAWRVVRSTLT